VVPDLAGGGLRRVGAWRRPRGPRRKSGPLPARSSTSKAVARRRTNAPQLSTTPRCTGSRCSKCRRRADFPWNGEGRRKATGSRQNIRSQGEWIRQVVNTDGCTGCHQLGGKGRTARDFPNQSILGRPPKDSKGRLGSPHSGRGRRAGGDERPIHAGRKTARSWRCTADWTDRLAAGELPAVATPPGPAGARTQRS